MIRVCKSKAKHSAPTDTDTVRDTVKDMVKDIINWGTDVRGMRFNNGVYAKHTSLMQTAGLMPK